MSTAIMPDLPKQATMPNTRRTSDHNSQDDKAEKFDDLEDGSRDFSQHGLIEDEAAVVAPITMPWKYKVRIGLHDSCEV